MGNLSPFRFVALVVVGLFLILDVGCSKTSDPEISSGGCERDSNCPVGEECTGAGCVSIRPTLYSHVQLASALLRPYLDENEKIWRATHADILLGTTIVDADLLRAENPNVRLFEYFTNKYYIDEYRLQGAPWATANGYDPEDFYLHYREDVYIPQLATMQLVPGFPLGVVPGWNPNRQPSDPPASATERSQARTLWPADDASPWCLGNVANEGYRRFLVDFVKRLLDGSLYGATVTTGPPEGVVVDNAVYYPQFNEGFIDKTDEFYGLPLDDNHPYALAYMTLVSDLEWGLRTRFGSGIDIMPNYGHTWFLLWQNRFAQDMQQLADWGWGEVWMMYRGGANPAQDITYEANYENGIANIVRQTRQGLRRVIGGMDIAGAIGGTQRGRLYTLALYYLVHNANTFFMYESALPAPTDQSASLWQWNPAVQYDIGRPATVPDGFIDFDGNSASNEHYEFATGPDPHNPSLTFHVFARKFSDGLVLVKMLPEGSVVDDRSITTHQLDRPYALLRSDGTPGVIVEEVSIRNNEGIILVIPR